MQMSQLTYKIYSNNELCLVLCSSVDFDGALWAIRHGWRRCVWIRSICALWWITWRTLWSLIIHILGRISWLAHAGIDWRRHWAVRSSSQLLSRSTQWLLLRLRSAVAIRRRTSRRNIWVLHQLLLCDLLSERGLRSV